MESKIKAIIFDWGETLHDPKGGVLFDGVLDLLAELSRKYFLILISLAVSETSEVRRKTIKDSGVEKYFKFILVDDKDKDGMYEKAFELLNFSPEEIAIVDDRVVRGIAWGNHHGVVTIRIKRGKYANESPTAETGDPTFTIEDIRELKNIL